MASISQESRPEDLSAATLTTTSLAVLALLAAGIEDADGQADKALRRGVAFLLSHLRDSGGFSVTPTAQWSTSAAEVLAVFALIDAYAIEQGVALGISALRALDALGAALDAGVGMRIGELDPRSWLVLVLQELRYVALEQRGLRLPSLAEIARPR